MQISCGVVSEISVPDIQWGDRSVCTAAPIPLEWAEGAGGDSGTEYPAGSYTYGDRDSAEVCSECSGRVFEREVSLETVSALCKDRERILGEAPVVAGVLREYGGVERGADPEICPVAGEE